MTHPTEKVNDIHQEYLDTTHNEEGAPELKKVVPDTVHNDEALKVLANYSGASTWTAEEEKRLVKKIDRRLMVILTITYGIQFYDKYMLSHAVSLHFSLGHSVSIRTIAITKDVSIILTSLQAIFGLITDLELTGNRYSWSASIFYLGYIVGAYPQVLLAQRYSVHRVISAIVLLWGLCVLATALCNNYQALYTQRFFLGLLESGVSPVRTTSLRGYVNVADLTRLGLDDGRWKLVHQARAKLQTGSLHLIDSVVKIILMPS